MKRLPLFALTTIAAFAADAPPTPQDWIIHIEFTAITLPEKTVLPLLDALSDEQKEQVAFAKIEAALAKGEATLEGRLIALTEHGVKKTAESSVEVRYPTEYGYATYLDLKSIKDTKPLPENLLSLLYPPSGFETRGEGLQLELQPQVSADGQWLKIDVTPQHTRLLKWDEYASGITPKGERLTIKQPRFGVSKDQFTLVIHSGKRSFVGIHKVPDQPKKMELFFIRAWTTRKPPGSEAVGK